MKIRPRLNSQNLGLNTQKPGNEFTPTAYKKNTIAWAFAKHSIPGLIPQRNIGSILGRILGRNHGWRNLRKNSCLEESMDHFLEMFRGIPGGLLEGIFDGMCCKIPDRVPGGKILKP